MVWVGTSLLTSGVVLQWAGTIKTTYAPAPTYTTSLFQHTRSLIKSSRLINLVLIAGDCNIVKATSNTNHSLTIHRGKSLLANKLTSLVPSEITALVWRAGGTNGSLVHLLCHGPSRWEWLYVCWTSPLSWSQFYVIALCHPHPTPTPNVQVTSLTYVLVSSVFDCVFRANLGSHAQGSSIIRYAHIARALYPHTLSKTGAF